MIVSAIEPKDNTTKHQNRSCLTLATHMNPDGPIWLNKNAELSSGLLIYVKESEGRAHKEYKHVYKQQKHARRLAIPVINHVEKCVSFGCGRVECSATVTNKNKTIFCRKIRESFNLAGIGKVLNILDYHVDLFVHSWST